MDPIEAIRGSSAPATSEAAKSLLSVGEVVGDRFEIAMLADWGGMGAVYRARDRHSGADVALKLLLDMSSEERFAREVRVLADLRHPGIVEYVAHGRTDRGAAYLAMEWLVGRDLRARLAAGPLGVRQALEVVGTAAEALAAAHARGIVHRDVNPRNLFLVGDAPRAVKVLDFGIARPVRTTFGMTQPGVTLGTPGYVAPEQARTQDAVDARADVFALGCVLYECLTGEPAFSADNLMALLGKVLFEDAPRLRQRGVFPEELDALVDRMMSKDRARRPADGGEVAARIAELLGAAPPEQEPAPMSAVAASLTDLEQRLVCVVMAAPSSDAPMLARDGATLASAGAESSRGQSALNRFGARIERLQDGSLVATLVGSGDATDHAANAARFALALREQLPDAPIVLATGRGMVTSAVPVGEALDRAARLLAATRELRSAEVTTRPIVLDEATGGLLDLRFDVVEQPSRLELRGARESSDAGRAVLGRPTSCVGRERDLRTLEATFEECVGDEVARAVLVTAPAGFGKTRLRREFLRRLRRRGEPVEVFVGRGDPMRAGAPFAMAAQTVTTAAGIADGESLAVRRQKLVARVSRTVAGEADRSRIAEFLGEIVGSPFPEEESLQLRAARQDPLLRGDQMRRAYEEWLRAECARQPVVLVLEDLHWGDVPTVKIVTDLLRNLRESPLLILASARPEVHDVFPGAWSHRSLVELRLPELTSKAAERLVHELLGPDAAEATVARIVAASEGNPFCIEELVRAEVAGRRDATPGSVLAVVSARIERLDPGARRVLRAASVFGEQFWRGAVAALVGASRAADIGRWLDYLVEQEVVVRRGRGRFPGEEELVFRHALVREAAYEMLVGDDRVLGHRLAGAWLEEAGEREAQTLAEHFDRGQAPERAIVWYLRSAQQALEGNDLDAAVERSRRAEALGASGEAHATALQIRAEALKWRGANAEARAAAREAMRTCRPETDGWAAAAGEVVAASGKLGDRAAIIEVAEAILALPPGTGGPAHVVATARATTQLALMGEAATVEKLLGRLKRATGAPESSVEGWVLEARGVAAGAAGDIGARVRLADAAAESFEAAGDLRNACLQRVSVGYAYNEIGAYADAERALRGAMGVAERLGLDNAVGTARAQLGRTLGRRGGLAEARQELERAIQVLLEQKNARLAGVARSYLARVLARTGDLAGAEQEAEAAAASLAGASAMAAAALATLSQVQRARDKGAEALETARRATAAIESAGKGAMGEAAVALAFAQALEAVGDASSKEVVAAAAIRLQARAKTLGDPALRRAFLEDVEEHATLLRMAGR